MAKLEQQILAEIAQLNRNALLRVMKVIVERLQEEETDDFGLSPYQWNRIEEAATQYQNNELATIDLQELKKRVEKLKA